MQEWTGGTGYTMGMVTSVAPAPSLAPPVPTADAARRIQLVRARRQATGLLVLVAAALVTVHVVADDDGAAGYLIAALEAAMVGGLADWFAVTAVFRHPLGLPIPHTAVIPERKDSFGETLGDFVQEHLLTRDAIVERIRSARPAQRAAAWLAQPENAARVAGHLVDASVTVADLLGDDDVHRAIDEAIRARIDATPLTPLAGRGLELVTDDGRHQEVLDVVLRAVDRFLRENRANLRARFGGEAPWWLPDAVEDRVFDRLLDGVHRVIVDVVGDPDHELRRDFDERVRRFAHDLQTSPELRARGEALKHELLAQPELRGWTATVWRDLKASLRAQADDPASPLQHRLAEALVGLATRLQEDPALAARVDEAVERAAQYVSEQFHDEIAAMISSAILRWDGREAATRLELLLGPDLQFIRINGTVVGGLAGLVIYSLTQALG
ncbi:MAG TPA: DUF445 domain-containing protein [Acidimicrobiales bacterium]|nr:DUF445 domain-containing protein [Acidimicrobiales bacterium]